MYSTQSDRNNSQITKITGKSLVRLVCVSVFSQNVDHSLSSHLPHVFLLITFYPPSFSSAPSDAYLPIPTRRSVQQLQRACAAKGDEAARAAKDKEAAAGALAAAEQQVNE